MVSHAPLIIIIYFLASSLTWNLEIMIDHDQSPKIIMLNESFFMIFGDLTSSPKIQRSPKTFLLTWWLFMTSGDVWWFLVIKSGSLSWLIMMYHDWSWQITILLGEVNTSNTPFTYRCTKTSAQACGITTHIMGTFAKGHVIFLNKNIQIFFIQNIHFFCTWPLERKI